jgi:hypothetical protein
VRQQRTIVPDLGGIFFGSSPWHVTEQWLLNAYDVGKDAERTFAVADIHGWHPADSLSSRVERSIAKQLQESMELNSRMKNRLTAMASRLEKEPDPAMRDAGDDLLMICKDEDPT